VTSLIAHAPTEHELERLYFELAQLGAPSVGNKRKWSYSPKTKEELVALAGEFLRYDPRLLSILLQFLLKSWRAFNPLYLREKMTQMRWPQALLVVLEFGKAACSDSEYRYWVEYLMAGWPRLQVAERFFFDVERPASRIAQRRLGRNLAPYARWGFVGTELPIVDDKTKRTVGRYDAVTRKRLLLDMAHARPFSLSEYLAVVDHSISRQQALHDLKSNQNLTVAGHGRGARWLLSEPRK